MTAKPQWLFSVDTLFVVLLLLALAFNLVPIWASRWLPMGDVGAHIELMDIVARSDDPETLYGETYTVSGLWGPNSLTHKVGWLLRPLVDVGLSAKLLISWYIVGLPLAMLAMCLAFRRSRWLVFFAFPMSFNALFNMGLLDFLVSLPLLFFAVALSRAMAERGGWIRGIGLALLLNLLYFAHIIAFLIGLGICLFILVFWCRGLKGLVRLIPLVLALPLPGAWIANKFVSRAATEAGRRMGGFGQEGLGSVFQRWDDLLGQVHAYGMRFFRDNTEERIVLALLLVWFALMALAQRGRATEVQDAALTTRLGRVRAYTLEIITLACITAYFFLPSDITEVEVITQRVVMIAFLLLAIWPRIDLEGWAARGVVAVLTGVALLFPWQVNAKFREFERTYLSELPGAIAGLPDRTRLSYVQWEHVNDITYMGPLWHIPKAIHSLANGGITDDSFAIRPTCPIQYREGMTPPRLHGDFWRSPHLTQFDYVLLRSSREPTGALSRSNLQLIFHQDPWWLFEVSQSRQDRAVQQVLVAGGSGGRQAAWLCPDGTAMRGFTGQAGRYLTNLVPACTPLQGEAQDSQDARERGVTRARDRRQELEGPQFGSSVQGQERFRAHCPSGEVMVGVHGRAGSVIDALGITCAPLSQLTQGAETVDLHRLETQGGDGGQPFDLVCPPGTAAIGFSGRSGDSIDAAGVACGAVR
ncbi:MAG: hypothetical protein JW797_07870 [Bradymonadales bacterium]|nr:hypothetical protein [Bradymonadales bacterium]